jgi:hsp70-interacting protein
VTVQNHAKAQADALACGAMAPLLAMAAGKDGGDAPCSDADLAETVGGDEETARARTRASFQLTRAKALYALSCLLRGCVAAQKAFALGDGFAILRACLLVDSAKIRTKVLHLARHLCQLDMIFMRAGVESGYVLAAAAALSGSLPRDFGAVADVALREDAERANVELAQVREAALRFIVDCAKKVDFEEVPKAVDHLRGTHVENALRSVRAAHEGMSAEDASACADEIALRVELERMLEG